MNAAPSKPKQALSAGMALNARPDFRMHSFETLGSESSPSNTPDAAAIHPEYMHAAQAAERRVIAAILHHGRERRRLAVLAALMSVVTVLAGCAAGGRTMTPEEARQGALALLDQTTKTTDLDWSTPGDPTGKKCSDGVSYQYMVHTPIASKQRELADSLAEYWRSKGLRVERSQQDFGEQYGDVFAATAKADGQPGAAFEITSSNALAYVSSQCVPGVPDGE